MSEITLRYKLTPDDLVKFNMIAVDRKIKTMRISCFVSAVAFGLCYALWVENIVSAVAIAAVMLILGAVYPYLVKMDIKSRCKESLHFEHETQLEFYNDHLTEKILPSQQSGLCAENHFPFEKIMNITESDELFLFFISPVEAIITPKTSMTTEDRKKLFHLIENVFPNRFTRLDLKRVMREDKSNNEKRG